MAEIASHIFQFDIVNNIKKRVLKMLRTPSILNSKIKFIYIFDKNQHRGTPMKISEGPFENQKIYEKINPFEVTEFFQSKNDLKNYSSGPENFSFSISEIIQPVTEL